MKQKVIITIMGTVEADNPYSLKAKAYEAAKEIDGIEVESVTVGTPRGPKKKD